VAKAVRSLSKNTHFSLKRTDLKNNKALIILVVLFVALGIFFVFRSLASVSQTSEPETWMISSSQNVAIRDDSNSSGGKYIEFLQPAVSNNSDYILIKKSELMTKPTSGPGWEKLIIKADEDWGEPNLADLNSKNQINALAGALVYARTGNLTYKQKVIDTIKKVCGTENTNGVVLPFARAMFGYVISADLVGMPYSEKCNNGQTWEQFLRESKSKKFAGNARWPNLDITRGEAASNWNAYALASHLAISTALKKQGANDQQNDIDQDINIYRRFLGDTTSPWPKFKPTRGYLYNDNGKTLDILGDSSVGINPNVQGDRRSGAIINDAIRTYPGPVASLSWDNEILGQGPIKTKGLTTEGKAYTEESLDGLLATYLILKNQGSDFAYAQNSALKRAFEFLIANGGMSPYSSDKYLPHALNKIYKTNFDTSLGDTPGRQLGFGQWLF